MKADDPCGCKSGLTYGECHKAIMEAPKTKVIGVAQALYARQWALNAEAYDQQGLYQALAGELATTSRITKVIDVSCGLGHGLVALREALGGEVLQVIGLDENAECLAVAAERLGAPQPVNNLRRIKNTVLPTKKIRIAYEGRDIELAGPVTLVQSDLTIEDPELLEWLDAQDPFDAVTQWFCGVHKARSEMEIAKKLKINSDADHRCEVEERTMALAARVLRPGGWVQMVIRGAYLSEGHAVDETAAGYGPLLNSGPFELRDVRAIRYNEPTVAGQIKVRSLDARVNELPGFAISMLAHRLG